MDKYWYRNPKYVRYMAKLWLDVVQPKKKWAAHPKPMAQPALDSLSINGQILLIILKREDSIVIELMSNISTLCNDKIFFPEIRTTKN